jgi:hypothetical protein
MKAITQQIFLLLSFFTYAEVWAEADQIQKLLGQKEELGQLRQALNERRVRLATEADSLSAYIDSLKQTAETASTELHEALRASLVLVARVVEVDQRLHSLEVEATGVRERLRLAYDWEIAQLIEYLSHQAERDALVKLMVCQQAREALGEETAPSGLRYGEDMDISQEDGPDDIAQKIELLEDSAERLMAESKKIERRLRRLEDERRLRAQVKVFTNQISLFDEHLPQGRILRQDQVAEEAAIEISDVAGARTVLNIDADALAQAVPAADPASALPVSLNSAPINSAPINSTPISDPILVEQQAHHEENSLERMRFGTDELILEISKLKSKQSEIRQLEAVLEERIGVFRRHRQDMLKGGD